MLTETRIYSKRHWFHTGMASVWNISNTLNIQCIVYWNTEKWGFQIQLQLNIFFILFATRIVRCNVPQFKVKDTSQPYQRCVHSTARGATLFGDLCSFLRCMDSDEGIVEFCRRRILRDRRTPNNEVQNGPGFVSFTPHQHLWNSKGRAFHASTHGTNTCHLHIENAYPIFYGYASLSYIKVIS